MNARNGPDPDKLLYEIRRYRFAQSDMRQAGAAALLLNEPSVRLNGDVERVLETGLVVTYARPFTAGGVGTLGGKHARPEAEEHRLLHMEMLARRNDLYAHSDITERREVVDAFAGFGTGTLGGKYFEAHHPVDRGQLPSVIALCGAQEGRYASKADALEAALRTLRRQPGHG